MQRALRELDAADDSVEGFERRCAEAAVRGAAEAREVVRRGFRDAAAEVAAAGQQLRASVLEVEAGDSVRRLGELEHVALGCGEWLARLFLRSAPPANSEAWQ